MFKIESKVDTQSPEYKENFDHMKKLVVEYKERTGLSRKTATLLLDHFHERGLTQRESGTHALLDEGAAKAAPLV